MTDTELINKISSLEEEKIDLAEKCKDNEISYGDYRIAVDQIDADLEKLERILKQPTKGATMNKQLEAKMAFGLPDPVPEPKEPSMAKVMDELSRCYGTIQKIVSEGAKALEQWQEMNKKIVADEWPLFAAYEAAKMSLCDSDQLRIKLLLDLSPHMQCEAILYGIRQDKATKIFALLKDWKPEPFGWSGDWHEITNEDLRKQILEVINEH